MVLPYAQVFQGRFQYERIHFAGGRQAARKLDRLVPFAGVDQTADGVQISLRLLPGLIRFLVVRTGSRHAE